MTGRAKKMSSIRGPPALLPASSSPLFLHPHSTSDILPAFFRRRAHQVQRARQDHGEGGGVDGGAGSREHARGLPKGGARGADVVHEEESRAFDLRTVRGEGSLKVASPARRGEALLGRRGLPHPQPPPARDPQCARGLAGDEPRRLESPAQATAGGAGHVDHRVPAGFGPSPSGPPRHRPAQEAGQGVAEAVLVKKDEVARRPLVDVGAHVSFKVGRVGEALPAEVGVLPLHGREGQAAGGAGGFGGTPPGSPAGAAQSRRGPAPAVRTAKAARAEGKEEVQYPAAGGASPHGRLTGGQGEEVGGEVGFEEAGGFSPGR